MEELTLKITAIQSQKQKQRYNVYIDGHYSFPVSEAVLVQFQLHKGLEITSDQIDQITNADLVSKAYDQALNYLLYQLRTEKEMTQYLHKHNITDSQIDEILHRLREHGYLDDLEYAKSYVRTMSRTSDKGPKIIIQNLRAKGIVENNIEISIAEFPLESQIQNAKKIIQKANRQYQHDAYKTRIHKIKNRLFTKGFSSDVIQEALEQAAITLNRDQEQEQLQFQAQKLMQRYQRLSSTQCRQKVKMALYRKGFTIDEINQFMDSQQ